MSHNIMEVDNDSDEICPSEDQLEDLLNKCNQLIRDKEINFTID